MDILPPAGGTGEVLFLRCPEKNFFKNFSASVTFKFENRHGYVPFFSFCASLEAMNTPMTAPNITHNMGEPEAIHVLPAQVINVA